MAFSFEDFCKTELPKIPFASVRSVVSLLEEGATIPFIARYRKEKTGNLDEVQVRDCGLVKEKYDETLKRQIFILKEIEGQGNLTPELKARIEKSFDLDQLEEIYRPFKKKRKTKATVAREAGIEPFANWIWSLAQGEIDDKTALEVKAKDFQNVEAQFVTYDQVLKGAQDILVERLSNESSLRDLVREDLWKSGKIISKKTKKLKATSKFATYADYTEDLKNLLLSKNSHRYLAVRRGWKEAELAVTMEGNPEKMEAAFFQFACKKPESQAASFLKQCAELSYKGYVLPSISNEVHKKLKETADEHAILVFSENVKKLLLASPFGSKCVLGIDPGIRTGCKLALIDNAGNYLTNTVIQIKGDKAKEETKKLFSELLEKVTVEAIAVGNGTNGRETEKFIKEVLKEIKKDVPVVLVNEAGASIYSASDVAREEFPDLDLTVRGAISIARRLQDPLAELVKIDPKSIGVGQYQHDVSQTKLKKNLEFVVSSCVNNVGVNLNTASAPLLSHISGIGPALAQNIADYRKANGLFEDRDSLIKVSRFSDSVFQQCAGFLRVPNSKNPLDKTAVHPESYQAVRDMAKDLDLNIGDLMGESAKKLLDLRTKWAEIVGEFTFQDIVDELSKPGRDPRGNFEPVQFRDDIHKIDDLKQDMICPGVVTNVTNFGAFVDIGVHQDGLVHISELSNEFVSDPRQAVSTGDTVKVKILNVDVEKKQISLSMKLTKEKSSKVSASKKKRSKANLKNSKAKGPKGKGPKPSHKPKGNQKPFNNPFADLMQLNKK